MKISYKKFCCIFLFVSFFLFFLNALLNYIVDPFEIFQHHFLAKKIAQNERFSKIEDFLNGKIKADSFLIGSSRIGTTDPKIMEKHLNGSNFYNFTLSSNNIIDTVTLINFLSKQHKIKYLYIQIDPDLWITTLDYKNPIDSLRYWHYAISKVQKWTYIQFYLFNFFGDFLWKKLQLNTPMLFHNTEEMLYLNDGRWSYTKTKAMRLQNIQKYVINTTDLAREFTRSNYPFPKTKVTKYIRKINAICRTNNIGCIFFTTPIYGKYYKSFSQAYIKEFLKTLVFNLDYPVWDFTYLNSVTANPKWYYESSHYAEDLAPLIAARIFNDKSVNVPNDFGVLLTKENIDAKLKEIRRIEATFSSNN